jgi:hypothetical protein
MQAEMLATNRSEKIGLDSGFSHATVCGPKPINEKKNMRATKQSLSLSNKVLQLLATT